MSDKATRQRLRELAEAATPGARHAERFFRAGDTPNTPGRYRIFLLGAANPRTNSRDCDWTFDDAHFIAKCDRETILGLLSSLDRTEAVVTAAVEWRRGLVTLPDGRVVDSDDGNAEPDMMRPANRDVLVREIDAYLAADRLTKPGAK